MNEHLKLLQELAESHYRKARIARDYGLTMGFVPEALNYLSEACYFQQVGASVTDQIRRLMNVEQEIVLEKLPKPD